MNDGDTLVHPVSFSVRPMSESDLVAVERIEARAQQAPWTLQSLSDCLCLRDICLVAASGERIVGYIILRPSSDEGDLLNIAVSPGSQHQGVGSALMVAGLESCHKLGLRRVYLEVRKGNVVARNFYAGFGFTEQGTRKGYYRSGAGPSEDAVLMSRDL